MQTFKAGQGLLVCWGGFNKMVLAESRQGHFRVRLWDNRDLVEAIYRNYERPPRGDSGGFAPEASVGRLSPRNLRNDHEPHPPVQDEGLGRKVAAEGAPEPVSLEGEQVFR